jgi:hypothetical protein
MARPAAGDTAGERPVPQLAFHRAFAVDLKFSSSLDALIMVDLRASDPAIVSRYMGAA